MKKWQPQAKRFASRHETLGWSLWNLRLAEAWSLGRNQLVLKAQNKSEKKKGSSEGINDQAWSFFL